MRPTGARVSNWDVEARFGYGKEDESESVRTNKGGDWTLEVTCSRLIGHSVAYSVSPISSSPHTSDNQLLTLCLMPL